MSEIKIKILRDDSIPAFGAWLAGSLGETEGIVLLNVQACFDAAKLTESDPTEVVISTLVHEFGHALEEYFKLEFSEERIAEIERGYTGESCEQAAEDERDAAHAFTQALFYEVGRGMFDDAAREHILHVAGNFGMEPLPPETL